MLLASFFAALLSPQEQTELGQGLATEAMCLSYISDSEQVYLRELKFKAIRNQPELSSWFNGFNIGIGEQQIKKNYYPSQKECIAALPVAFERLELLRKLGDGTRN